MYYEFGNTNEIRNYFNPDQDFIETNIAYYFNQKNK